jgi:hypothetical protein
METDPLDIDAQDAIRQQREDLAKQQLRLRIEDYKWLMSSKRGRRLVFGQLESAGVYRTSFNTNALQMSFNEGGRNQGLMLLAFITEHTPERYAEMIEESKQ